MADRPAPPKIELDDVSVAALQAQMKRRKLEESIEAARLQQKSQMGTGEHAQKLSDRVDEVWDLLQVISWLAWGASILSAITGGYVLIRYGFAEFAVVVGFLGVPIRPHVISALLAFFFVNWMVLIRIRRDLGRRLHLRIEEPAGLRKALEASRILSCTLLMAIGISMAGWEVVLTHLGGLKATVILSVLAGTFVWYFAVHVFGYAQED